MSSDTSAATRPQPYAAPAPAARHAPSRALAFLLSLFAAGTGQLYVGRTRRAVGWLALAALGPPVVGTLLPAASRAGLLLFALLVFAVPLLARPLSAFDTLGLALPPDGRRPTAVVVVVAFGVSFGVMVASPFVTRTFLVEAFKIPSGAMMPTLLVGDHVFVDKTATALHRGRPAVFRFPENTAQDFVERVVAIGGDRLEMRDGRPWINGWEVPHCVVGRGTLPDGPGEKEKEGEVVVEYLEGEAYVTFLDGSSPPGADGPWTVKEGEAFVLGDNRRKSHDSRYWFDGAGGGVPQRLILGEPFVIWLSVSDSGADLSRSGRRLAEPTLPPTLRALRPALERCLAGRPSRESTVPPQPR